MKHIALIAAMLTGSAALAHATPDPAHPVAGQPATERPATQTPQTDQAPSVSAPSGTSPTAGATPPTTTHGMASDHSMESQPSTTQAQSGTMGTAAPGEDWSVSASQPAMGGPEEGETVAQPLNSFQPIQRSDYPNCTRQVTDNCVQRNDPGGNDPR